MAQSVPGTGSTEKSSRCHVPSLPFDMKPIQSSVRNLGVTLSPSAVTGSPSGGVTVHDHVPAFGPDMCSSTSTPTQASTGTSATFRPPATTRPAANETVGPTAN